MLISKKTVHADGSFLLELENIYAWYDPSGELADCAYKRKNGKQFASVSPKHTEVIASLVALGKRESCKVD